MSFTFGDDVMAQKPNFTRFGNKTSGSGPKSNESRPSSKQTNKTHHDSLKGNRGNGGGKNR